MLLYYSTVWIITKIELAAFVQVVILRVKWISCAEKEAPCASIPPVNIFNVLSLKP